MKKLHILGLASAAAALALVGTAFAGSHGKKAMMADGKTEAAVIKPTAAGHPLADGIFSGYRWLTPPTKAMQDNEFENPAGIWLEIGQTNWDKVEGTAGKACASCHKGGAATAMKGVATRWPIYDPVTKKILTLNQRINRCRTQNMQAKAWKWESGKMMGMVIYVKNQSLGMPMNVKVDGPAAPFFAKGKAFYYQRRGQMDMACAHCHEANAGGILRANVLTQGQSNGFPTYRLKWQKPGTIHRRFVGCNKQVRATPYKRGSDEYSNLELYLTWRGQGLPVETPAVRN